MVATQEVVVTGGKIKSVTITANPSSLTELQQKGFSTTAANQGQGGAAPTGAPATGFGPPSTGWHWLILPLVLAMLARVRVVQVYG